MVMPRWSGAYVVLGKKSSRTETAVDSAGGGIEAAPEPSVLGEPAGGGEAAPGAAVVVACDVVGWDGPPPEQPPSETISTPTIKGMVVRRIANPSYLVQRKVGAWRTIRGCRERGSRVVP